MNIYPLMRYYKIIVIIIIGFSLISCDNKNKISSNKPQIAVTIYPLKAIISEIAGDKFDINVILPIGASPHTFEPKPSDMEKIHHSKIVFYVENGFDSWVLDVDSNKFIQLLEVIDEQMLIEVAHIHAEDQHIAHKNIDPHFWLSPKIVQSILPEITKLIIALDAPNKEYYLSRSAKFNDKLDELQDSVNNILSTVKNEKIFTFHNSFSYYIRDFDLTYGGAIEEYAGKEAGTKYIIELTKAITASKVRTIFSEPQLNAKSVETIAEELNINIAELDPIGGTKDKETYWNLILNNAKHLHFALTY